MVKKLAKSAFLHIKIIFTFFGMKTLSLRYSLGMKLEELQRFLEQHEKSLILYARQWCNAPEDVVQEALMELVRKQLDPVQNTAWVYTVVRNKAVSLARRSSKMKPMAGQNCEPWFESKQAMQSMPMLPSFTFKNWLNLSGKCWSLNFGAGFPLKK